MKVPNNIEGIGEMPKSQAAIPQEIGQVLCDPKACREAFKDTKQDTKNEVSEGDLQKKALQAAAEGDFKKAEKIFLELLKLSESKHGKSSKEVANALTQLGMVCEMDGRFADAKNYYKQAAKVDQVVYGKNAFETGLNVQNVAHMENLLGNYPEAAKWYEEALRIYRLNDPYHDATVGKETIATIQDYAKMLLKMGESKKAAALVLELNAISKSLREQGLI